MPPCVIERITPEVLIESFEGGSEVLGSTESPPDFFVIEEGFIRRKGDGKIFHKLQHFGEEVHCLFKFIFVLGFFFP